jgi:hypothetical protein
MSYSSDARLTAGLRRKVVRVAIAGIVAGSPVCLGSSAASASDGAPQANAVVVWDRNAQIAMWDVAQQQPPEQSRSAAMVHGAIYDAVNAIAGTPYQPYLTAPRVKGATSMDAAVASAAYRVLSALFPDQRKRLTTQYDEALAGIPAGGPRQRGIAVGDQAASAMIAARKNDGAYGDQTWAVGTEPGQWRPTPPAFASSSAWIAHLKPFLIPSGSMFRTSGPPALTGKHYAEDINEVKEIGSKTSTVRTEDQTQAAIWWHDRDGGGDWQIKRQLATTRRLSTLQTARMYAMVNLSKADATIACNSEKAAWHFWRPITAIREAGTDGNPDTTPDSNWEPLLDTPPHPDFTSGHTCSTGASMSSLRHFFGRDDLSFSAFSPQAGATRYYRSFSQALAEVIEARVWGGIHTRSADVQGAEIGKQVSTYMGAHYFKPVT